MVFDHAAAVADPRPGSDSRRSVLNAVPGRTDRHEHMTATWVALQLPSVLERRPACAGRRLPGDMSERRDYEALARLQAAARRHAAEVLAVSAALAEQHADRAQAQGDLTAAEHQRETARRVRATLKRLSAHSAGG